MIDFLVVELADLRDWLVERGYPGFQAEQIYSWVFDKGVRDWQHMTNLSAPLREELAKGFRLTALQPRRDRAGAGGVQKFLWQLIDKNYVDSVMTPGRQGWKLSISSQVGCPAACTFCASGKRFVRNLQPAEMIDQFLQARAWVQERGARDIGHISFDGMGEPFKNTNSILTTLDVLCERLGFPAKKITMSTVGMIEGIERLLQAQLAVNLIVGLHAGNQQLRQKLVPYAKKNKLPELMDICRRYSMQMGIPIQFDYVMIEGVNDHPDQAFELTHLIKKMRCQLRLLPFNPTPGIHFKPSSKKAIKAFRSVLFGSKIPNTLEEGKGQDIGAALGQLSPMTQQIPT